MTPFHKIEQKSYRNAKLLSEVINVTGLKNDAALSRALEVAPPVISKIRTGRLKLGANMLVRLHLLSGISIDQMKKLLAVGL
jgi:plasmid maintenance system antidote protein VapI